MSSTFSTPYVGAVQAFYNKMGEGYDLMTHDLHSDAAAKLIETCNIRKGDRVLDLATGTGNVAFKAASKVGSSGKVLGIDVSDGFLKLASRKAEEQGLQNYVQFDHQDVMNLSLPSGFEERSFDVVTCGSAIAMFPDPKAVVRIVATKILKPGGIFAADQHAAHIPGKEFIEAAKPHGFQAPIDSVWLKEPDKCLQNIFEGSGFDVKSIVKNEIAAGIMKWDVSTSSALEKLWQSLIEDHTWLSFGVKKLSEDTLEEVKKAWMERMIKLRNDEGIIVGERTQYIAVAVLRSDYI